MPRLLLFSIILFLCQCKSVPQSTSVSSKVVVKEKVNSEYRAAYTSTFDLIHTKIEIKPDFKSRTVKGLATILLHPHFYSSDTLVLNAHQMIIIGVSLIDSVRTITYKHELPYENTSSLLKIYLGRKYSKDEIVTVQIDYIGQPELVLPDGSVAIKSNRGFYFIDPDSVDEKMPTQFWTQGETESNSSWFPTIESPQQKMTQEIYLTVDTAFTTLSNGLLLSSVINPDGTRTDYWKQSLPAAPYLTMVAAGKFAKVSERWRNISVDYYTDPEYSPYAKMTYGHTPEMMEYFSKCLGVDYPWEKYAQVVVHQFISGAMENTTAVVHGENLQQDSREYKDRNYEDYIAHELFHHWFGDLVTCKSWSKDRKSVV